MDGPDGLDGLGIPGGGRKGLNVSALSGDTLDLVGLWHPALHTGHIHPHAHAHRCQQRRQQHRTLPGAAENFQGFPQQHGHSEAAHQRHQHHAQQHSRQVGPDIIGTGQTEGHAVQDHAQRQTAYAAHAVAQHRPHPREGRHIAGELAAPPDTQQAGQCNDRHRNGGIDPQCLPAAVFQRAHISADDGIAHILSDDALRIRQPADQLHHRSTPQGEAAEVTLLIAEDEQLSQPVDQLHDCHHQKVYPHIQHRHRQQPAGEHGAQRAKSQKEDLRQRHYRQPYQQRTRLAAHQQAHQYHQQIPGGEHGKARQQLGEKQGLPLQGQAVYQSHGPAVHQVGIQGHGQHTAEHKGHDDTHAVGTLAHLRNRPGSVACALGYVPQIQLHRQRHHPDGGIQKQNGPVAAQIAAGQCRIKERCHGPHSQHLPAHR